MNQPLIRRRNAHKPSQQMELREKLALALQTHLTEKFDSHSEIAAFLGASRPMVGYLMRNEVYKLSLISLLEFAFTAKLNVDIVISPMTEV